MQSDELCDELDGLLASADETAPALDELHGYMSAALCGPNALSFSECVCALLLPDAAGEEDSECELPSRLVELLRALYEDTKRSIEDGSFAPVVSCEQGGDEEGDSADARQWCCGFLMCVEGSRERWHLENSRVLELLTPIVLLAEEREFERAAAQLQGIDAGGFRQQLLEELPGSVCAFRKLFRKKPQARRAVRTAARTAQKRRPGRGVVKKM